MTWLSFLGIAVLLIAIASVFGLTPKGGRPAARTRLMAVARVILILLGVILLYAGWNR